MKNKILGLVKSRFTAVVAVIGFAALLALSTTACSKSGIGSGGGGGKSLNSATELKEYLDKQPANSPDKPIKVAMKANDMMIEGIAEVIKNAGKYVSLDLSGSPLTEIPRNASENCGTLAGITIPNSATSIGEFAFADCRSLTSVTFQGAIASDNFDHPFPGDLRDKYLAGGMGTYTRDSNYTWTKQ